MKNNYASLPIKNNVVVNVIDKETNQVVQSYEGHNECTNSLLSGVAHYLVGDGVLNQAQSDSILSAFVPKYISLGTMGLLSQEADANGLPKHIGDTNNPFGYSADNYPNTESAVGKLYDDYASKCPGFGSDGYDATLNNGRGYFGLGRVFTTNNGNNIDCEIIAPNFSRSQITHREIVAESESEQAKTIDIVYSTMISTGALAQFRGDNDYIFITECGLWGDKPNWELKTETVEDNGVSYNRAYYTIEDFWSLNSDVSNGLLAGYRMVPTSVQDRYFTADSVKRSGMISPYVDDSMTSLKDISDIDREARTLARANLDKLKKSILRVGPNQVVQVVWKVQLGDMAQFNKYSV